MVALDMDGTLLNKQHTLSERSIAKLRSLSDRGIIVSLCSGPVSYTHLTLPTICSV